MKKLLFEFGDWMTRIGEKRNIRVLIYNPVTWLRFLISAWRNGKAFASALKFHHPELKSCVDIGAGAGGYVRACRKAGFEATGFEYSAAGRFLAKLQSVQLNRFDCGDVKFRPNVRADMAFSIEVAEHLPEELADSFVECIAKCSDLVFFTAAQPNQPGQGHINCQPPDYWRKKFESHGFIHLEEQSLQFSETWNARGFKGFASRNLQIFRRSGQ
jgi:hypothetical protein